MSIYVYPPVSLSITSGPTSFVKDGATVTVNEDTITPANSRPLPIKVLNSAGVQVDPATEAKQDVGNTSLSSIDGKMTTLNAKDFATSAKQDSLLAELQLKADLTDTQPVSIAGTVAVSGPLTDAQLRATAVPVTANAGTNLNTSALSLEATQLLIKAKTDNLDVALSTRNSEATQLLIKAKTDNLDVALSTVAKDATLLASNTLIGAVTEAAPASDTASSGLNGRLQRIAQRLTSLIALLPTALGQGTMATSLKVVLPSDQSAIPVTATKATTSGTPTHTQKAVGLTEVRATVAGTAPNAARKRLMIKPSTANTGKIYLIATGGTIANGMEIVGPDRLEFLFDATDYYLISDTAAQVVDIFEVA